MHSTVPKTQFTCPQPALKELPRPPPPPPRTQKRREHSNRRNLDGSAKTTYCHCFDLSSLNILLLVVHFFRFKLLIQYTREGETMNHRKQEINLGYQLDLRYNWQTLDNEKHSLIAHTLDNNTCNAPVDYFTMID